MCKGVSEDLLQLLCTRVNSGKQLVQHVHGGHVVTKHANENFAEVCRTNGFTNRAQFQVIVVHQLNIGGGPRVLHKMETVEVLVPCTPTTRARISGDKHCALRCEPVALHSVL